ncbi:MAG: hypothetical protein HY569_01630 [Candidatus Magasanikbacteria bacterium]|nr:hypothetical protein [Candidatus Magasanikbacteria bacterium]
MTEIEEILAKNIDIDKIIADYEFLPKQILKKEKLRQTIKSEELLTLLAINDIIFSIHDRRKECMTQAIHYLDFLMAEIGRRFNLPLYDLRYIRASELDQLPNIAEELRSRRERSLYVVLPGGKEALFIGDEAENLFKTLEKTDAENKSSVEILRGNCASPGKVTGIVKICRGEVELGKVNDGDILVACMTQPEFLPAVKKAKAIITDEGGITCHAAIVSRELGIPCVIGTKIATKVLKDGDEVEVDANHGVVTVIARKAPMRR